MDNKFDKSDFETQLMENGGGNDLKADKDFKKYAFTEEEIKMTLLKIDVKVFVEGLVNEEITETEFFEKIREI